jgi:hypothetical protein
MLHYTILENVSTRDLPALLSPASVYRAERWYPAQPEGERAAQITAGNVSAGEPLADYYAWLTELGADGAGITVAVADSGLDTGDPATLHPDLFGRVTFATALCTDNEDTDGHGTNVASIAVGDPRPASGGTGLVDSLGFYWGSGSAPGASLYFQTAINALCLFNNDAATLAADAVGVGGAQIGSHSFSDGQGSGAGYNSQAQAWDALVRDADPVAPGSQEYAVLFSAGNERFSGLTSPKAAKNIVTVGATENQRASECPDVEGCGGSADDIEEVAAFSSWGLTGDERLKPDVVAPGHVISGAYSSMAAYSCLCDGGAATACCDSQNVDGQLAYTRYSGTSQAAPRLAGASALIFDWFEQRTGSLPSPAMNKAILVNSAVDLKDANVPNRFEGWGRVSLRDVLQAPEQVQLIDQTTIVDTTGDPGAFTTSFFVQEPELPVKTTLVWTDPPAAINCRPCVLNDLDLVVSNGGQSWLGNHFIDGMSALGGVPDPLNNVEQVHLPALTVDCSQPIEVKVRATSLSGDGVPGNATPTDQDFALVLRNAGTTPGPPFVATPSSAVGGGCDGDGFLDRGESVQITVDLENNGCSASTGVTAVLRVLAVPPGAVVQISPAAAQAVPDLPAADMRQASWQLTLEESVVNQCGQALVLEVEVQDGSGSTWLDTVSVALDGEGSAPLPLLDTADTDQSESADLAWKLNGCRTSSPPSSWHMGDGDCSGIPQDGQQHSVVFRYPLLPTDSLASLTFQHAFNGYHDATSFDTIHVEFDHDDDGVFQVLETWFDGINNPGVMATAGPYDLSGFQASRADEVSIRLRFRSGAAWLVPNDAAGWDVDDIALVLDRVVCDPQTCAPCLPATPVPDGTIGGNPMQVQHAGADLRLTWTPMADAVRYHIYVGDLGMFYSHDSFSDPLMNGGDSCNATGNWTLVTMPPEDTYFLVASDNGCFESHYGTDSGGVPRPFAPLPCNTHYVSPELLPPLTGPASCREQ